MTTAFIEALKEWLASQLETATEQGGNEILEGLYVEEVDVAGGEDNEVIAILSEGTTISFHINKWGA